VTLFATHAPGRQLESTAQGTLPCASPPHNTSEQSDQDAIQTMNKEETREHAQLDLYTLIDESRANDFVLVISRHADQWEVALTDLCPRRSRTMVGRGKTFSEAWATRKLEWS
jgi:hypothetical protein